MISETELNFLKDYYFKNTFLKTFNEAKAFLNGCLSDRTISKDRCLLNYRLNEKDRSLILEDARGFIIEIGYCNL